MGEGSPWAGQTRGSAPPEGSLEVGKGQPDRLAFWTLAGTLEGPWHLPAGVLRGEQSPGGGS